jgi:transcription elongation factor GreA
MIDSSATYLTPEGYERLKQELSQLVHVRRKEIAARIQEAKELGDLSENAEYQSAREEQGVNEGRIEELEATLRTAILIADDNKASVVQVGSTVEIEMNGKKQKLQIVGSNEADPMNGLISNASPLGQALLGKEAGAVTTVQAPKGDTSCTIVSIS